MYKQRLLKRIPPTPPPILFAIRKQVYSKSTHQAYKSMKLPVEHDHIVDFDKMKREAFILLNLGYGFLRIRDDDEGDMKAREESHLFQNFGKLYSRKISSILTNISISGRMLDDIIKRNDKGVPASNWAYEEMLGLNAINDNFLTLRDCFNKIIHAERIDHELMQLPEVYLGGKMQNGKEWNVTIYILPFCTSVFQWVVEYQNS